MPKNIITNNFMMKTPVRELEVDKRGSYLRRWDDGQGVHKQLERQRMRWGWQVGMSDADIAEMWMARSELKTYARQSTLVWAYVFHMSSIEISQSIRALETPEMTYLVIERKFEVLTTCQ